MMARERDLQNQVIDYLRKAGVMFWRGNPHGHNPKFAHMIEENGGMPDLFVLIEGVLAGFELKLPEGKDPSPAQLSWQERLKCNFGRYYVIRHLAEAMTAVLELQG